MNFTKTVFINSAGAFFFLFFLHGFSIGNGQQGISYNVIGNGQQGISYNVKTLGEGGDFNHKCRFGERMLNIAVIVERSTATPLLPSVCYMPPFFV